MINSIKTVILLVLLILATTQANNSWGKDHDDLETLSPDYMRTLFENIILNDTPLPRENLKILNFCSHPTELQVPSGTIGYEVISTTTAKQLGRKTVFTTILVDGKPQGRVKLSGDIQLYGNVLCATKAIQRNTILSGNDLTVIHRNISMLGPGIIDSPALAVGKQLKTALTPGAIIYKRFIKAPQLVTRGDMVTILAGSNSLKITVPGRVQTSGVKGDIIKVKNLMSRKEVYAMVISSDQVKVDF